jgi:nitrogen fixation NifU-like protein
MSQEELYREIILDHARRPRNSGALPPPACRIVADNPLCGDELTLYLRCEKSPSGESTVADCKFEAQACAICVASASLMTTKVKGLTRQDAEKVADLFQGMLRLGPDEPLNEEMKSLGDLAVLEGVRKFPLRVKCATLPWHALAGALREAGEEAAQSATE